MDYNKRAEPLKSSHTWADMYNTSYGTGEFKKYSKFKEEPP